MKKFEIAECRKVFKESGIKGVLKKYGWKIFAGVFVYYLVRDLTIYIFIPYAVAKGIWN